MSVSVLIGAQWGDEGKGKIVDVLSEEADIVVRFKGGNNAGHTVKIGETQHVLHLIPSGIMHQGKICVIGNGLVVDPVSLLSEIADLQAKGVDVESRLLVSDRAHVVFPYHREIDGARESSAGGAKIGTTKRGIGPAYGDKVLRAGFRMCDIIKPSFADTFRVSVAKANETIVSLGGAVLDIDKTVETAVDAAQKLKPFITDTISYLAEAVKAGKKILLEGAQGTMLDIDYGTYPFVTSSNTTSGSACTGSGIGPGKIDKVIGVVKAYTTRVGEGPFPTELKDETGEFLGREGREFGATTGRPRRCGWFDAVVARYAAAVNGVDNWAITKLDVLDSLETVKICVAYEYEGIRYEMVPADTDILSKCTPVYEEMEGWQCSTKEITQIEDIPARARLFVDRLCALMGGDLAILSTGPGRENTLRIKEL